MTTVRLFFLTTFLTTTGLGVSVTVSAGGTASSFATGRDVRGALTVVLAGSLAASRLSWAGSSWMSVSRLSIAKEMGGMTSGVTVREWLAQKKPPPEAVSTPVAMMGSVCAFIHRRSDSGEDRDPSPMAMGSCGEMEKPAIF